MANFYESVGVELEGYVPACDYDWFNSKIDSYARYGLGEEVPDIGDDCSIEAEEDAATLEIGFWACDYKRVLKFVKKCYELGFGSNTSCGAHVHFRMNNDNILYMFTFKSFWDRFFELYDKFTQRKKLAGYKRYFEKRLGNDYCKTKYNWCLMSELNLSRGDYMDRASYPRYYGINFVSLFEYQKTVEFRILPGVPHYWLYQTQFIWLLNTITKILQNGETEKTQWFTKEADKNCNIVVPLQKTNEIKIIKEGKKYVHHCLLP